MTEQHTKREQVIADLATMGQQMFSRQLPTREQIGEALYENQFRGGYHVEWERLVDDARDFWLSQADAVLALLNGADRG